MARVNLQERLLRLLEEDARLRTLPLAVRAFWLLLARAALRHGGAIPFTSASRVSLLVSASETETETHLEILIGETLVTQDETGLRIPLLEAMAPRRAGAAAENGRLGGRPRKGETAEQARLRRSQGHLPLSIEGGAAARQAETQETENPETPTRARAERESLSHNYQSSSSPSSSVSGKAVFGHEAQALARELATMLSLGLAQPEVVGGWLRKGWSPTVIRQVASAFAQQPERPEIRSIRYLEQQIAQQVEAEAPPPPANPALERYHADLAAWHRRGCLGDPPARPVAAAA
ncbi:hypothetical protein [Pseudoroseomonas cervicalis]|uniref:hypothetical protein n=1 Tax=Teichococcus cervicalis TaxID=204525 RepID=UPI0027857388|nr:hypothetical protein [Pseudoroseomonas cervicalis]MDQ1079707.1 hypothetical protein [Pseudoroseomonas cervicalis]